MPTNFFHDAERDRVYLAQSTEDYTTMETLANAAELKGAAARSINEYFHQLQIGKQLAIVSIDAFVGNALNLVAVRKYLDDDETLEYVRRAIIKNHISTLLKNYIDSKE